MRNSEKRWIGGYFMLDYEGKRYCWGLLHLLDSVGHYIRFETLWNKDFKTLGEAKQDFEEFLNRNGIGLDEIVFVEHIEEVSEGWK